jgi:hypothetical protein
MNPFKSVMELQLQLVYQWLTVTKQWLEVYSASSASVKPIPVVAKQAAKIRGKVGCVGPADLNG